MNEDRALNLECNEKTGEIAYFVHYPIGNQGRSFTPMTVSLIKRDPLLGTHFIDFAVLSKFLKVASYWW